MKAALFAVLGLLAASLQAAPVTVTGSVPDEASKAALLARVRALYGAEVLDKVSVGGVQALPQWSQDVEKAFGAQLKDIGGGQLKFEGRSVHVSGAVASEALRQQIGAQLAAALGPGYRLDNALRVAVPVQKNIDDLLATRTVEFESGKAVLTAAGAVVLDEVHKLLAGARYQRLELIGHTDDVGARAANMALSLARAQAARSYMAAKGIDTALMTASGEGPDRPRLDNLSAENRARNRRIDFRIIY